MLSKKWIAWMLGSLVGLGGFVGMADQADAVQNRGRGYGNRGTMARGGYGYGGRSAYGYRSFSPNMYYGYNNYNNGYNAYYGGYYRYPNGYYPYNRGYGVGVGVGGWPVGPSFGGQSFPSGPSFGGGGGFRFGGR